MFEEGASQLGIANSMAARKSAFELANVESGLASVTYHDQCIHYQVVDHPRGGDPLIPINLHSLYKLHTDHYGERNEDEYQAKRESDAKLAVLGGPPYQTSLTTASDMYAVGHHPREERKCNDASDYSGYVPFTSLGKLYPAQ